MDSKYHGGFTLIELMTTLLVAAVVLGIGVPAFNQFIATNQMASGVNDLTSALHMARTEAVKRRANVTLCASANPEAAAPTCNAGGNIADGWIVFVDCAAAPPPGTCGAPNYAVNGGDVVIGRHAALIDDLADNFTTNPNVDPAYVTFAPTGFPMDIPALGGVRAITDFGLCDHRGNTDVGGGVAAGRWIRISPTGRPQIYRNVAEIQSAQNPLNGC